MLGGVRTQKAVPKHTAKRSSGLAARSCGDDSSDERSPNSFFFAFRCTESRCLVHHIGAIPTLALVLLDVLLSYGHAHPCRLCPFPHTHRPPKDQPSAPCLEASPPPRLLTFIRPPNTAAKHRNGSKRRHQGGAAALAVGRRREASLLRARTLGQHWQRQ